MGIDAVLRTEAGQELASVPDPAMVLSRAATSAKFADTRLLRYLVPWGDTIFNQAQAADLRDDIRVLIQASKESPIGRHLVEINKLVEQLASENHGYLWFVGD